MEQRISPEESFELSSEIHALRRDGARLAALIDRLRSRGALLPEEFEVFARRLDVLDGEWERAVLRLAKLRNGS
jgi:hypothetical protein